MAVHKLVPVDKQLAEIYPFGPQGKDKFVRACSCYEKMIGFGCVAVWFQKLEPNTPLV